MAPEAHAACKTLRLGSQNGTASCNCWHGCWMISNQEVGEKVAVSFKAWCSCFLGSLLSCKGAVMLLRNCCCFLWAMGGWSSCSMVPFPHLSEVCIVWLLATWRFWYAADGIRSIGQSWYVHRCYLCIMGINTVLCWAGVFYWEAFLQKINWTLLERIAVFLVKDLYKVLFWSFIFCSVLTHTHTPPPEERTLFYLWLWRCVSGQRKCFWSFAEPLGSKELCRKQHGATVSHASCGIASWVSVRHKSCWFLILKQELLWGVRKLEIMCIRNIFLVKSLLWDSEINSPS